MPLYIWTLPSALSARQLSVSVNKFCLFLNSMGMEESMEACFLCSAYSMLMILLVVHFFLYVCIHILLVHLWRTLINNTEPRATLFNNMLFNTEWLHQNPFLLDFLFPFLILSFPTLFFFCSNPYSTYVWCSVFPNFLKPRHKVSLKHICFGLYAWFNKYFMNSSTVWDLNHEQRIQTRIEHGSWPWETQINWE